MAPIAIKPFLCGKITSKIVVFTESTFILPFKLDLRLACHFDVIKRENNDSKVIKTLIWPNGANLILIFARFPSSSNLSPETTKINMPEQQSRKKC